MAAESTNPVEIFYSYAHEDERLRKQLENHLSLMKQEGLIIGWFDRDIRAGEEWAREIETHLNTAEIILLLVSPDFMASQYCYGVEMRRALERHEAKEARVIPIILRPVDWEKAPFGRLQALPKDAKPVTRWQDRDQAFLDVARGIRKAIEELAVMTPSSPKRLSNIPFARNPFFTGREDILKHLQETLTKGKTAALTQPPQAISGLGGIGKTQTAVEYAYRYGAEYQYMFWVRAEKREELVSGFVAIAELLNLSEKNVQDQSKTVAAVKRWLQDHTGWLLILDNADDLEMAREFLPTTSEGHILLTTRAQAMGRLAQKVDVEKMGSEEGALFLLRRANIIGADAPLEDASATDRTKAQEIVEAVDGLPLALDQAGAYIEETGCGLAGYLSRYRAQRPQLLKRRGGLVSDHRDPVATTWKLSFQKVEQANPAAADLLRLCAFLTPDAIPEEIITEGAPDLTQALQEVASSPVKLDDAIEELRKYSLVRRDPDDQTLTIHRLVQAVVKDEMNKRIQRRWAERAVRAINNAFPGVEYETWPQCRRLLPHAQVCAKLIEQWDMAFPEAARLLNQAGLYLNDRGQYAEAESHHQQALAIRERVRGLEHTEVANSLNNLALVYINRGHFAEAESLYQQALVINEKVSGPDDPSVAANLVGLAALYTAQGKHTAAEPLLQRAIAIDEKAYGTEHHEVAIDLNNLASLYYNQGKYAEAEQLLQRSLKIREKLLVAVHPAVAIALNNLAFFYVAQGKYAKAEPLYLRVIAIDENAYGPEHPEVATDLENYAILLRKTNRETEAANLEARAGAIRAKHAQKNPREGE